MCVRARGSVRACVLACACWHRRHLEISPSPFKWEVSGRAQRTVSAGSPDQGDRKSPGVTERASE